MPAPDAASDFATLFGGWGVTFDAATAVADPAYALTTTRRVDGREANIGSPAWLRLDADAFYQKTPALARLSAMVMTTVGSFGTTENGPTLVPLATSSDQAVLAGASKAADRFGDPRDLVAKGTATETAPIVMARMSGPVSSAFPDGKPDGSEWEAEHLSKTASANVLLSGDADMLVDGNWIQQRSIFGTQVPQAFAKNGDFFLNAVEQMAGGPTLADLRGRAVDWRPLTRIDAMERAAEAQYRATEEALFDRILEAEKSLRELAPESEDASVLGSAKKVAKAEELRADLLAARAELRQVHYDLRRDVEALQACVTTLNVGFVPFFAAVIALFVALRRPKRTVPDKAA